MATERIQSRQGQFKKTSREEESSRRHAALLSQQSKARANRIDEVRRVAIEALLGSSEVNDVEKEIEVEDDVEDDFNDDNLDADMDPCDRQQVKGNKMRRLRRLHRTLYFARQMQAPDWMIEVPEDLSRSWMMMVRPEGERCLLLSDDGRVQVRRKNGYVHERFTDVRMPRGFTMLDVVCVEGPPDPSQELPQLDDESGVLEESVETEMQIEGDKEAYENEVDVEESSIADDPMSTNSGRGGKLRTRGRGYTSGGRTGGKGKSGKGAPRRSRAHPNRKYAVCDVLFWDGTDMVSADTECRMFWLASRFAELPEKTPKKARPLVLIPAVDVTAEAVAEAYHADVGYSKDSLMFMHREAQYAIDTPVTPLVLMWRDRQISRFVIDTPDEKGEQLPEHQVVVLELRGSGYLRTADKALVAQVALESLNGVIQQHEQSKARGMLLRCEIEGVDVSGKKLVGVKPVMQVPSRSRVWADSWGRILFQYLNRQRRTEPICFEAVAQAAAGMAPPVS